MVIRKADEAEELAQQYLQNRYSVTGNIITTSVGFDGNFFTISGYWEEGETRFDFEVKADKDGNIVGWRVTP